MNRVPVLHAFSGNVSLRMSVLILARYSRSLRKEMGIEKPPMSNKEEALYHLRALVKHGGVSDPEGFIGQVERLGA